MDRFEGGGGKTDTSVVRASEFVKGIWYDWRLCPESSLYNMAYLSESSCNLDIPKLEHSLQTLVDINVVLRSSFFEKDGRLFQRTDNPYKACLLRRTAESKAVKHKIASDLAGKPYDLTRGPLFRFLLIQHEYDQKYSLGIFIHHIIIDGICFNQLFEELRLLYNGDAPENGFGENLNMYLDYQDWLSQHLDYSKKDISNCHKNINDQDFFHEAGNKKPKSNTPRYGFSDFTALSCLLPRELNGRLFEFSQKNEITIFHILKTAWTLLMSRYASRNHLAISCAVSLRPKKYDSVKGYMANIIFDGYAEKGNFFDQLARSTDHFKVAVKNQKFIPFYRVYDSLSRKMGNTGKIFPRVGFTMVRLPKRGLEKDTEFDYELMPQAGEHRILMLYYTAAEGVKFHISYNKHYFDSSFVEAIMDNFYFLLKTLMENPDKPTKTLCVLSPGQHRKLVCHPGRTGQDVLINQPIHRVFEDQMKKTPEHPALVVKNKKFSYRRLNQIANQTADAVRCGYVEKFGKKIKPDTLIGLYIDPSPEMVTGILAILKAGAAYVPFDISDPLERTRKKIRDCGCRMVVTSTRCRPQLMDLVDNNCLVIDDRDRDCPGADARKTKTGEDENPVNINTAKDLAYVIYTSGSTGEPKGVMVEHSGVVNLVRDHKKRLGITPHSRILQYGSICFDVSVSTLFCALLSGGCAYLIDEDTRKDTRLLQECIIDNKIDFINIPPVLLGLLETKKQLVSVLKTIIVGGEVCDNDSMEKWADKVALFNAYGPTEVTVTASLHKYEKGDKNTNIGTAVDNKTLYILDNYMNPVPMGVAGELYIGGKGIARGYLNRAELTKKRFIPTGSANLSGPVKNGLASQKLDRADPDYPLYKTGDACKWLSDGSVEFLGRMDDQVKIRGFRIETKEVEAGISSFKDIKQAVVISNNNHLLAYYLAEVTVDKEKLRGYLSKRLPDYMMPAVWVQMEKFPVNNSGKIDRKRLPQAGLTGNESSYVPPVGNIEKKLCALCRELLAVNNVGVTDDFFSMGGNSIQALKFVVEVNKRWGINIPVSKIFLYPRIGELAEYLKREKPYQDLVYFNPDGNDLPRLYMVPLMGCGSEIYIELAAYLKNEFSCVGIENYNMYHRTKIKDVYRLAEYYADKICGNNGTVWLLGTSFAGQMAIHIAEVLEKKGIKRIKLVLLDTILFSRFYKSLSDFEFRIIKTAVKILDFAGIKKVFGFSLSEKAQKFEKFARAAICYDFSKKLSHTQVLLFRATGRYQRQKSHKKKLADYMVIHWALCAFSFIMSFFVNDFNNLNKVAPKIKKTDLNCHHSNVIHFHKEILESIKSF